MTPLLILCALFAALFGLVNVTPQTIGVGCVCAGCLFAILARIAQAQAHFNADHKTETESEPVQSEHAPSTT